MEKTGKILKKRLVTVQTRLGERKLLMEPSPNMTGADEYICETRCPYSKVCSFIPDPRKPEGTPNIDEVDGFISFCGSLGKGEDEDSELRDYYPAEGSIEKTFKDFPDIYKIVIDKNPLVNIKDVISSACKGWCPDYSDDYCNCTSQNMSCILRGLFTNTKALDEKLKTSTKEEKTNKEEPKEEAKNE